jgi:hypothetical protein
MGPVLCSLQALASSHQFSGFATLGVVSNDNPELGFRRDLTQRYGSVDGKLEWRTDSLIGVQWRGDWTPELETTLQFVLKDRIDNSVERSLEWGFVGYRPADDWTLRLGRLGADIFLLSDYRQVNYAMPWVRPPADYYGFISYYHLDGIDVNKRFDFDESTLNIKLAYGNTKQKFPPPVRGAGSFELDFNGADFIAVYERESWKFRFSFASAVINNRTPQTPLDSALSAFEPLWPEAKDLAYGLDIKDKAIKHASLGVVYDDNTWWARTELARVTTSTLVISNTRFFYVSVGRYFGDVSLYLTGGAARAENGPSRVETPTGYPSPLAESLVAVGAGLDVLINSNRPYQDSIGVGLRWDFKSKMALKFQIDKYQAEENGSNLWLKKNLALINAGGDANVVSTSLDVLF